VRKTLFILIVCILMIAFSLPVLGQEEEFIASTEKQTEAQPLKLALIWWVDTVDLSDLQVINRANYRAEYMREIRDMVKRQLISRFSDSYILVADDINDALRSNGYDLHAFDMPDKDTIIKISQDANVDAILIFELSHLGLQYPSGTHLQFYTASSYRAYNAKNNRYIARRALYDGDVFRFKMFGGKSEILERLEILMKETLDNLLRELPF
jgi:hypothetical protein